MGTYSFVVGETAYTIPVISLVSLMLFSTLLGSVYERSKEYATIACLGATPQKIYLILFLEGSYIASVGGLLTIFLTYPLLKNNLIPLESTGKDLGTVLLFSLTFSYVAVVSAFLAIRLKGVLKVTPSGLEKIRVRYTKGGRVIEIPLKIHNIEYFKKYLRKLSERRNIRAGVKVLKVWDENGKNVMVIALGVDREVPYKAILEIRGNSVLVELKGLETWTADHTRMLNTAIREIRRLIIDFTIVKL